eukprot:GILK01001148.1.p1 GENE.GILK01001148.1~~GILK01001148.1.p1  ORF type:complete len:343 (-),score=45.04 GILK01001148.1:91-1119(-)
MASSPMTTTGWQAAAPNAPLENGPIDLPPLGENDVEVQMKACGVCFSDVDALSGKYGPFYKWPMVAGHEGVGVVTTLGSAVTNLKVGDVVGCGVYRNTCGTCRYCADGRSNLCPRKSMMFARSNGCFSEVLRINCRYAFKIPSGYDMKFAGPLMCAGTTVFAPFVNHNIRPGDRVGVIGIGGLGHLALQIARAWGCQVTAFSSTPDKEAEAKSFGAHHFVSFKDADWTSKAANSLDFLLMTASGGNLDWKGLVRSLDNDGVMVLMGVSHTDIPVSPVDLILGQRSIAGSAAGSQAVTQQVINFCALHDIKPQIETFPFDQCNEAIERVKANSVRYRAVLLRE